MQEDSRRDELLSLLAKHRGALSGYIYSLVEDWSVVEETLQETALFMAKRWRDFEPGSHFAAWARMVARMRCREVLRKEHRQQAIAKSVSEAIPDETWDECGVFEPAMTQALAECLRDLPEKSREVLHLRYHLGHACADIAASLGRSLESIYMLLSRVRQALRKCIEGKLSKDAT